MKRYKLELRYTKQDYPIDYEDAITDLQIENRIARVIFENGNLQFLNMNEILYITLSELKEK